MPLLVTESDVVLFESDAIAEYLDEVYPPVENDVKAEQRALDRAWIYQATKHYLIQCGTMSSSDPGVFAERFSKLEKAFARAEASLGETRFFKGEQLSNVDIAWLPLLHRADIVEKHSGYDFFSNYPKVKTWQQALMDTGIPGQSVAEGFETAFTNFYLSPKTYLGRLNKENEAIQQEASRCCYESSCC